MKERQEGAGMYMNGVGTMKRARELGDAMFDALLPAIFGSSFALAGPLLAWAVCIHRFPCDEPASTASVCLGLGIAVVSVASGIAASLPWWRAKRAIAEYTANMKAETEKRGPGWAHS